MEARAEEKKSTSSSSVGNPLVNHIKAFADSEGFVSEASVRKHLQIEWPNITEDKAQAIAKRTMDFATFTQLPGTVGRIRGLFFGSGTGKFKAEDGVPALVHPHDTGFYNKDGTFNEELFNAFVDKYGVWKDGKLLISKSRVIEYLEDRHKSLRGKSSLEHERWGKQGCCPIKAMFNKLGQGANKNEFDLFFDNCSSVRTVDTTTGEREYYVTVGEMRTFYLNTPQVVEQVAAGELPAKPTPK